MVITSSGTCHHGPRTADGLGPEGVRPSRPPLCSRPGREPTGRPTVFSLGLAVGLHGLLIVAWSDIPAHRSAHQSRPQPPVELVTYLSVQDWTASAYPGVQPSRHATGTGSGLDASAAERGAATPDPMASRLGISGSGAVPVPAEDLSTGETEIRGWPSRLGPQFLDLRLVVPGHRPGTHRSEREEFLDEFRKRLAAFTDSLPFDEARENRLREWTWTDGAGRAWGVREGVIIVNGTSISAEYYPDRDRQVSQRMQVQRSRESQRQGEDAERERHLAERDRALRVRRSTQRGGGGN